MEWVKRVGLQQTMKFSLALGNKEAQTLGHAWAHRMQFLHDKDLEGLFRTPALKHDTLAAYQEPEAFAALMATAEGDLRDVGERIRALLQG